jgi:pimeloyl-ACP methyl ester carboxylesterase
VFVAHSYAGFIAQMMAATDRRVAGIVLVDANLASFFDDAQVKHLLDIYRPQMGELEKAKPELARVLNPQLLVYGDMVKRVRQADFPATMPVIDIVAEKSWGDTPAQNDALQKAHAAFVAASPAREAVFAAGSGHQVMRDRPEIVLDAIKRMVEKVRAAR